MSFPEKWNMKLVAWMLGAIPNLKSWVWDLASTSMYAERLWRDLSKGRWEAKTHGLGKDVVMRPISGERKNSIPTSKPAKDKKRKKSSPSEDPEPKKKKARKPRKNIILLTEESVRHLMEEDEEVEENDSELVARLGMSTEAPKATESVKAAEIPSRDEGVSGKDLGEVLESSRIEDASHHTEPMDSALHREVFSRSRAELSQCEANLRGLTEERNSLKLLYGLKEEETKDLRAELAKACQDQTDLIEQVMKILKAHGIDSGTVANISISQLQQKVERIEQLREEVNMMNAEILGWKEGMDRFAAEKETALSKLSSAESQLRGMSEKSSAQARKIEQLEA
ncbi:synaptonemal complex protein ZIP1-like [Nicotiana tomentosiformis]|uniref:synaptonemal complex protein ZIP1-like n=1 Tax=Nicotiana tomentosiformis TaxID=4098 RepID=UPI00388C90C9